MAGTAIYLTEKDLERLHAGITRAFGDDPALLNRDALESCVAQPKMKVFGHQRFPTLWDKAAAYCYFVVRNHPFVDGNKRAGLLAAIHFLRKNGFDPLLCEEESYEVVNGVAAGHRGIEDLAAMFAKSIGRGPSGDRQP